MDHFNHNQTFSIPAIAVSGVKNSGKTTLLSGIIPILRNKGLKVAVIKHDGHDFEPDVPGTDSFKLRAAGAEVSAVFSDRRYMIIAEQCGTTLEYMISRINGVNLILVEGAKGSNLPKIEIVRSGNSDASVCDPSTLLALCTDTDVQVPGVPSVSLQDYEALASLIINFVHRRQKQVVA